jgi:CheY-like chemotaxis protein
MTRVLLVEDEPLIQMLAADVLEDEGFDVITAETADAALKVLEAGADVQVLFTDVRMPGSLDGCELACMVHERWHQVGLLVTSGHVKLRDSDLPDDGHFIAKPYKPEQVIQQIREVAAGPSKSSEALYRLILGREDGLVFSKLTSRPGSSANCARWACTSVEAAAGGASLTTWELARSA